MTAEFDPCHPPLSVLKSIDRIRSKLRQSTPLDQTKLAKVVETTDIRKEFYESVAQWTRRQQSGKSRRERDAILRHLIRTVFAWILKENGFLSDLPFEAGFVAQYSQDDYHGDVLAYLFHERLNTPNAQRRAHPNQEIHAALECVPFLNGSLFAQHEGDADLRLGYDDYFGVALDEPGLFTLLSRYAWTMDEHTPNESDQSIDPEILSNLFEYLFAASEVWDETPPDRMPRGTYYTPSDVASEMVLDALSAAVRAKGEIRLDNAELRDLFGNPYAEPPTLPLVESQNLRNVIRDLSLYDPTVGSGVFLFLAAQALYRALTALGEGASGLMRRIVQTQLYAQDISSMGVQITRLRLFLAILSSEKNHKDPQPLPNLEGRIVCADTLATHARPEWRPEGTGEITLEDPDIRNALLALAKVRRDWIDAHTEEAKRNIREADRIARSRLSTLLRARTDKEQHPELLAFTDYPLLHPDAPPARVDARLLFYHSQWPGFDIVIGNPPYEAIGKDKSQEEKRGIRIELQRRMYQTVPGCDLYHLAIEAGLALVKPSGGVVVLVVPLSLAFGQNKATVRQLLERRAVAIHLRHQDNGPDMTFLSSPVNNPTSRQRTTIIVAEIGEGEANLKTTGTNRWRKAEREQYFRSRNYTSIPPRPKNFYPGNARMSMSGQIHDKLASQWPRIPSESIGRLISEMRIQKSNVQSLVRT